MYRRLPPSPRRRSISKAHRQTRGMRPCKPTWPEAPSALPGGRKNRRYLRQRGPDRQWHCRFRCHRRFAQRHSGDQRRLTRRYRRRPGHAGRTVRHCPGATFAFYSGDSDQSSTATAVTSLKNAGCKIIVDDLGYSDEPMFQDGVISTAINSFVAGGGSYFSAIGNDGNSGYMHRPQIHHQRRRHFRQFHRGQFQRGRRQPRLHRDRRRGHDPGMGQPI